MAEPQTRYVGAQTLKYLFDPARFRLPLGISLIAALLAMLGLGSIGAGSYVLIATEGANPWLVASALAAGPAILYLAYQLFRLAHWTWRTLIVVLVLLLLSSLIRLAVTPGLAIAPLAEILIEIVSLIYLTRPAIRGRFNLPPVS
jgi:hypothetical protein